MFVPSALTFCEKVMHNTGAMFYALRLQLQDADEGKMSIFPFAMRRANRCEHFPK